jgi:hypothetical protein
MKEDMDKRGMQSPLSHRFLIITLAHHGELELGLGMEKIFLEMGLVEEGG